MSSFFSGSPAKTSTKTKLSKEQKKLVNLATPYVEQFAKNPPPAPSGTQIVPFNPAQTQAQQMAMDAATGAQQNIANKAAGASDFLLGDVLYPESNPALQGYIDAATRPITENLQENILPSLRGQEEATGNYSSSKGGQMEAAAMRDANRAIGDTAARIASEGYGQGLEAYTKGLALAPSTAGLQIQPAGTVATVGDVQQNLAQQQATEQWNLARQQEMWPLILGEDILGAQQMLPGGSTVTTGSPASASPAAQTLGTLAAGGSALSKYLPLLTMI